MRYTWRIVFLMLIWCGFSHNFGVANIALGAIVATLCFLLLRSKKTHYRIRFFPLLLLLGFTLVELIKSSFMVAWDVITPKHLNKPKILAVELACQNDAERTLLANILSLTPGTLSIDLSEDKSLLKIHAMFAGNPSEVINFIKNRLEPKVLKVFYDKDV